MTTKPLTTAKIAAAKKMAGGTGAAEKLGLRVLQVASSPGVYEFSVIVNPDGTRQLVVKNNGQPYRLDSAV